MIGYYVVCVACVACVPYFYHSIIMNIESVNKQTASNKQHQTYYISCANTNHHPQHTLKNTDQICI